MSPRKLMKWLSKTLRNIGVLITLGLVLIALLIWFAGPALQIGDFAPFGSSTVRLACLLALALTWGIGSLFFRVKRSSEEESLLAALRKQQEEELAADQKAGAALAGEVGAFREAVAATTQLLRKGRAGVFSNARYVLPWYAVLGSDSAGKTAIIRSSGLTMPFDADATASGADTLFHITDRAVLVEFPGSILDQQDRRQSALWPRLLDTLKRMRSHQPINGILLVASTEDLLSMQEEDCAHYAASLRKRLDEMMGQLRTIAPVYVVITKLDLIVGFEEFFETLSAEERISTLGVPLSALRTIDGRAAKGTFQSGFAGMVERFSQQQFVRLQEEPDEFRRRRLFEFPGQFALLRSRLEPLIQQLSAAHRFGPAPNIRGVFFTSTLQTSDFADQFGQSLAAGFGQRKGNLALAPEDGLQRARAFFLTGLFRDVILPEANLSGLTRPALVAARLRDIAANIALIVVILALLGLWWLSFSEGRAYMSRIGDDVAATRTDIAEAAPEGKIPTSFEPVLAVLDKLDSLEQEQPQSTTLGLYQTGAVRDASRAAYDKALRNMLFPFVWNYLQQGLADPKTPAAMRFQQLKFYLMLSGKRPADRQTAALLAPDFVARWLTGDRNSEIDRRVAAHFSELATIKFASAAPDKALIDGARAQISTYTLARLAYDAALALPQVQGLSVWRPVDHMGLSGSQALSRVSKASFWDGIEGIYTKAGLKDVMLGAARSVAMDLSADLWVMGNDGNLVEQERESLRIREGMLDLYRVDYIGKWDSLLADLGMGESANAGDIARSIAIITGNPSPVRELIAAIAAETDLEAASTTVLDSVQGGATQVLTIGSSALSPRRAVNVAKTVSEHFKTLREAVAAPEGQPAPLDAMLVAMQPLYRQLNLIATGGDVLELGAEPQTLLGQLSERNSSLPASLQPLFARIMSRTAAITGGSSRERLSDIWRSTVLPLCQATTQARYPFNLASVNDASLEDFARLFGPKGAISGFRENYLKPFIDSSAKPWRWKTGQQIGLGYDNAILAALELSDDIKTVYFGDNEKPGVEFTLKAAKLDMRARAFVLETGGPTLLYNHGPVVDTQFQWPSENITAGANMSMMPEMDGERNSLSQQGAWALFRLLSLGKVIERDPTDVITYRFSVGTRQVLLRLTAPPTRNPFARNLLTGYACPEL